MLKKKKGGGIKTGVWLMHCIKMYSFEHRSGSETDLEES